MTFPPGGGSPDSKPILLQDDFEELPEGTPAWINLSAGAFAGIAEHSITYPFDSIKTRMQVLKPHPEAIYHGTLDAIKRISRSPEGLTRLWKGVMSVVIGAGPAHAIYFGAYEQAKSMLLPRGADASSSPLSTGAAGAVATSLSDGFMTPFDVIKQRMQLHGSPFKNVVQCGLSILKNEGWAAFYVAYPTTLLLNVPFHIVQFPTYEWMRKQLVPSGSEYHAVSHIVAGGAAGGLASALTTPIDVIKTTLQTRGGGLQRIGGMREAIAIVYRERGMAGFGRGLVPRMLTHMPATAICWTFYEYLKWMLRSSP